MKAVPDQIARWVPAGRRFVPLGTDGFGRSDTREALRRHFETDAPHVVVATLAALAAERRREARGRHRRHRPLRHRPRARRPAPRLTPNGFVCADHRQRCCAHTEVEINGEADDEGQGAGQEEPHHRGQPNCCATKPSDRGTMPNRIPDTLPSDTATPLRPGSAA